MLQQCWNIHRSFPIRSTFHSPRVSLSRTVYVASSGPLWPVLCYKWPAETISLIDSSSHAGFRLLFALTPTAYKRSGQSEHRVPPAPIRTHERNSRLGHRMRILATRHNRTRTLPRNIANKDVDNVKEGICTPRLIGWSDHLLGQCRNLYTGIEDQLKTMNVLKIWNVLHN